MSEAQISAETLEQAPHSVLKFVRAVLRHPVLWNLLATRGYNLEHHRAGWATLHGVSMPVEGGPVGSVDPVVAKAEGEAQLWDDQWFAIIQAVTEADHPGQYAMLFAGGLKAVAGPESVLVTHTMLGRLDVLESGEGRPEADRAADRAAMDALAAHGLTPAVRAAARELLRVVEGGAVNPALDPQAAAAAREAAVAAARAAELAAYRWWKKWSTIARQVITRKDHLQWLGLVARKKPVRKARSAEPALPGEPE